MDIIRLNDTMKYKDDFFFVQGHVRMTDNTGKVLVDKDNHIVTTGRSWLMSRMFNIPESSGSETYNWIPGWFSIGNGGASIDSPFTPIWPTDEDTELYNRLKFNQTGALYCSDGYHKLIDSVSFPSSLTAKATMTLDYNDFDDSIINEAGLYVAPTQTESTTQFRMFSHVTFPSFPKSLYQKIQIEWFFMF